MSGWTQDELRRLGETDDLRAPMIGGRSRAATVRVTPSRADTP